MYKTLLNSVKTELLRKSKMTQVERIFGLPVYQTRLYCSPVPCESRKIISLTKMSNEFVQSLEKNPKEIEWNNIRNYLLSLPLVNQVNVDSVVLDACYELSKMNAAISYIEFLKKNKYEINWTIKLKHMLTYYFKGDDLSQAEKKEMLDIYDELRREYDMLPVSLAEHCISCLTITHRWLEAIQLLEDIKICNRPGRKSYSNIIVAALQNDKFDICWKYIIEMLSMDLIPTNSVYIEYLHYCQRNQTHFKEYMEKLYRLWQDYGICVPSVVMEIYVRVHNELGFPSRLVKIQESGTCNSCLRKLKDPNIQPSDLESMRRFIVKLLFAENGPYSKSLPEEHKNFLRFIDRTKPYDVVIDGLNVFYRNNKNAWIIQAVAKKFVAENKKVLIIAREHTKKNILMNYYKNNIHYFFVPNDTSDDIYLLYSVISSGVHAKFVSDDLMRQHKHLFGSKQRMTKFKTWQMSRQCSVKVNRRSVDILEPPSYAMNVQKNNNSWHIPFFTEPYFDNYEVLTNWACITYPHENY